MVFAMTSLTSKTRYAQGKANQIPVSWVSSMATDVADPASTEVGKLLGASAPSGTKSAMLHANCSNIVRSVNPANGCHCGAKQVVVSDENGKNT